MDTEILLLDEPFGALDAKIRKQLQALLQELWLNDGKEKKTVVFVTHDIDEAVLLADRIIYMMPGRVERELEIRIPRPRKSGDDLSFYKDQLLRLFELSGEEGAEYEE